MSENEIKVKLTANVDDFTNKMKDAESAVDQFQEKSIADIDAFINKLKDAENEADNFQKKYDGLATGVSSNVETSKSTGTSDDLSNIIQTGKDWLGIQSFKDVLDYGADIATIRGSGKKSLPMPDLKKSTYPDTADSLAEDMGEWPSDVQNRYANTKPVGKAPEPFGTMREPSKMPTPEIDSKIPGFGMGEAGASSLAPEALASAEAGTAVEGAAATTTETVVGGLGSMALPFAAGAALGLGGVWALNKSGAMDAIGNIGADVGKNNLASAAISDIILAAGGAPLLALGVGVNDLVSGRSGDILSDEWTMATGIIDKNKAAANDLFGGLFKGSNEQQTKPWEANVTYPYVNPLNLERPGQVSQNNTVNFNIDKVSSDYDVDSMYARWEHNLMMGRKASGVPSV